ERRGPPRYKHYPASVGLVAPLLDPPDKPRCAVGIFDLFKTKPKAGKGKEAGPPRPKPKLKVDLKKRFDLHARTGQGSMSKVWRAYDREVGMPVCLKLLDKEKTKKFEARFIGRNKPSEGEICMMLRHPHIVRTFDFGYLATGEP